MPLPPPRDLVALEPHALVDAFERHRHPGQERYVGQEGPTRRAVQAVGAFLCEVPHGERADGPLRVGPGPDLVPGVEVRCELASHRQEQRREPCHPDWAPGDRSEDHGEPTQITAAVLPAICYIQSGGGLTKSENGYHGHDCPYAGADQRVPKGVSLELSCDIAVLCPDQMQQLNRIAVGE